MAHDVFGADGWVKGEGAAFENLCPSTGQVSWSGHAAGRDQVEACAVQARTAFTDWSIKTQQARTDIMTVYAAELAARENQIAKAISRDMGKPFWESKTEAKAMVSKVAISIQAQAERAGLQRQQTAFGGTELSHNPHGVMAVFGPFNFPGHLPNGHIVPALLAGNTCLFKPSEQAPGVATLMVEAFEAAGLPRGCLCLVQGGRETGAALLDTDIDGVLFTGSEVTGRYIHKYFAGRPEVILALEMGGNNPLIIQNTDNIDGAADLAFFSAFVSSGQRCSCARRLIVPNDKFGEKIINAVAKRIDAAAIGLWDDAPDVFMGPLVNVAAAKTALAFERMLISKGAISVRTLETDARSRALLRPALIDVTGVSGIPDEELFGPVLQVIRTGSVDEAINVANATKYGLAAGLICDDQALWTYVKPRLRAGIVNWNRPTTGAASSLPFGGPGLSGNHRPGAYYAADYCAWPKATQVAMKPVGLSAPGFKVKQDR